MSLIFQVKRFGQALLRLPPGPIGSGARCAYPWYAMRHRVAAGFPLIHPCLQTLSALGGGLLLALCLAFSAPAAAVVDFSGHWERDYRLSDDVNEEFKSHYQRLQREAERRAQSMDRGVSSPRMNYGSGNVASLVGLARMADLITDVELLEIIQDASRVEVDREGSFALVCDFNGDAPQVHSDPFGKEICGWDDHQLVIKIVLPDGLTVIHRFTLAQRKDKLNIATTVYSDRVSRPFTLDRVYRRYEPAEEDYRCEETLSRGKVCHRSRGISLSELEEEQSSETSGGKISLERFLEPSE